MTPEKWIDFLSKCVIEGFYFCVIERVREGHLSLVPVQLDSDSLQSSLSRERRLWPSRRASVKPTITLNAPHAAIKQPSIFWVGLCGYSYLPQTPIRNLNVPAVAPWVKPFRTEDTHAWFEPFWVIRKVSQVMAFIKCHAGEIFGQCKRFVWGVGIQNDGTWWYIIDRKDRWDYVDIWL